MPDEDQVTSVPLPDDDGDDVVIVQQNAGPEAVQGGGEWPSPTTEPTGPAPG